MGNFENFGIPRFENLEPNDDIYFLKIEDSSIITTKVKQVRPHKRFPQYTVVEYYIKSGNVNITTDLLRLAEKEYDTKVTSVIIVNARDTTAILSSKGSNTVMLSAVATNKEKLRKWVTKGINTLMSKKTH